MNQKVYLGVDLGAESGRVIAGLCEDPGAALHPFRQCEMEGYGR